MNTQSTHPMTLVAEKVRRATGAWQPPYSHDLNLIEMALAKAQGRKCAQRSSEQSTPPRPSGVSAITPNRVQKRLQCRGIWTKREGWFSQSGKKHDARFPLQFVGSAYW